jgi:hypothetical protein
MKEELEQKLINEFPVELGIINGQFPPLTHSLMSFGCECRDGWFDIIYNCLKGIKEFNNTFLKNPDDYKIAVMQIKEKYGTLRIYTNYSYDEIDKLIEDATKLSAKTCEVCSSIENVYPTKSGWIQTLCEKCHNKLEGEVE